MPGPLFTFSGVTVRFGPLVALEEVDLVVEDAGVTVLTGPSGAGKSTLLRLCNRLEVATSGTVRYRGRDLDELDPLALRREVGMVFQRPTLFPGTVRDNLALARPGADEGELVSAVERAGLPAGFLERVGDDLSGGEAQRACLARTLVTAPRVLLMDEPTSSVDPETVLALERSVRAESDAGVAVLWVTHDPTQARRIGDHRVELSHGRVGAAEPTEDGDGR